ncbi:MAG: M1 family metallopeptidase [Thermoplasmata archaeon]|nr:M1 family metallopeptidase [Thermoplasmata archaeon]
MRHEPPHIPEYRLRLDVDFEGATWTGSVEFTVDFPPGPLELDCDELEVISVRRGDRELPFVVEPRPGLLTIPSAGDGSQPLRIEFSGSVRPKGLVGLYRCRHGDGFVLTTQCEPVGARRIFPCLDRPDRKSRVQLSVRTRADLEVIANMPSPSPTPVEGGLDWRFEPTPPMSSYLFYLGIGRFDRAEDRSGPITVRVLGPPGRGADCAYSVEVARRVLHGCAEYYSIPYPLSKLDLVAVSEHAFGAMENWGAMSFREVRLLIDAGSTTFQRRDVFETVAHEIAHQWFGNLVTMTTWDDVWLNESFASFLETRISERLEPSMEARTDSFLRVAGTTAAFDGDSLPSTHPVRSHVERPEEINQIFDEISYGKGAAILGMAEGFLGEDRFRAGVTDYLNRFRYGNARTEDLWDSLERLSGERVGRMLQPWIDRPGHPIVRLRTGEHEITVHQERFSLLGSFAEPPWPIPLFLQIDRTPSRMILDVTDRTIPIPPGATVHLNPGAVGFYRVRYDETMYDRLFAALPRRSPEDRWSVVEDLGAFLLSGEVDWSVFERAVRILGATTDRLVIESFASTLLALGLHYPTVGPVQGVVRGFFADRLASVGVRAVSGEPLTHGVLRERLSFSRARVDLGFARDLSERFSEWNRLDPNLRAGVAVAHARAEGSAGWNDLRRVLDQPRTEAESTHLERGLAWSGDAGRVRATLQLLESGVILRSHFAATLVQVAANPIGRPVLWPWLQEHLPMLTEQFRGSGALGTMFETITPYLGMGRSEEVRAYFQDHPLPEGSRGLAKGLERLEVYERLGVRFRTLA